MIERDDSLNLGKSSLRLKLLWIIFLFWSLIVLLRMGQIMIFQRSSYLPSADISSWHFQIVPAGRGRLLDNTGRSLAWSTRHFRLLWQVPYYASDAEVELNNITRMIEVDPEWTHAHVRLFLDKEIVVKNDISPEDFKKIAEKRDDLPASLKLESYFIRHKIGGSGLRRRIGSTVMEDGIQIGVSGFEKKYDSLLRGRPGVIRFFVTEQGEPIWDTREVIREMKPGHDVYLPFSLRK